MDKGAINGGHVLLLPIEHFPSSLACSENAWAEMQRYLSALKACAASQVPFLAAFCLVHSALCLPIASCLEVSVLCPLPAYSTAEFCPSWSAS